MRRCGDGMGYGEEERLGCGAVCSSHTVRCVAVPLDAMKRDRRGFGMPPVLGAIASRRAAIHSILSCSDPALRSVVMGAMSLSPCDVTAKQHEPPTSDETTWVLTFRMTTPFALIERSVGGVS